MTDSHQKEIQTKADQQSSDATARLLADTLQGPASQPLSTGEKTALVVRSAIEGTVTNGLDELKHNPQRFLLETGGAVAMSLALKGPAWVKLPALGVATVGTAAFASHIVDSARQTSDILDKANHSNLDESAQRLRATLGPLVVDGAFMAASGHAAGKLATRLPANFSDLLPGPFEMPGPRLAMAGGMHMGSGPRSLEPIRMTAKPENPNVMLSESRIVGGRGGNNETIRRVERLAPQEKAVLTHNDGSVIEIGGKGQVSVGFPSGEARLVEIGQQIKHIVGTEHPNGLKQFRLNGSSMPNLEIDPTHHVVRAIMSNGDHLHLTDNVVNGYMQFNHRSGLKSWVEYNGKLTFQLPDGKIHVVQLKDNPAHIKMIESATGETRFRFLDPQGRLMSQTVDLPRLPEIKTVEVRDPENPMQRAINRYIHNRSNQSEQSGGGGVYRVESSEGGMLGGGQKRKSQGPPYWMPKWPSSIERGYAKEIAGVDPRVMRGNDLSSPADMALAQQDHSWLVKNYLSRLNATDDNF